MITVHFLYQVLQASINQQNKYSSDILVIKLCVLLLQKQTTLTGQQTLENQSNFY